MFTKSHARRAPAGSRLVAAFAIAVCLLLPAGGTALGSAHGSTARPLSVVCPPGEYDDGVCVDATPGHYAPGGGTTDIPCAAGEYQPLPKQDACTPTVAGFYAPGTGNIEATPCAEGTYVLDPGADACLLADAGFYAFGTSNFAETPCAAGSYQPATAQGSCILASIGYYVPSSGSALQTQCPAFHTTSHTGATSCRAMNALERLRVLKTYVTDIGPGSYLRHHVWVARTALIAHHTLTARANLKLVKAKARAESGITLSHAQMREIVMEVNAILVLL